MYYIIAFKETQFLKIILHLSYIALFKTLKEALEFHALFIQTYIHTPVIVNYNAATAALGQTDRGVHNG